MKLLELVLRLVGLMVRPFLWFGRYQVCPPKSFEQLREAFELVYQEYLRQDYCSPHKSGLRFSLFDFLPQCMKFVGVDRRGAVHATASLVIDSTVGLPADNSFSGELDELRAAGCRLAEGTMLAVRREKALRTERLAPRLMAALLNAARQEGVSDYVVVVNPKHVGFYTRCLGFKAASAMKKCEYVKDAPGVLLRRSTDPLQVDAASRFTTWALTLFSFLAAAPEKRTWESGRVMELLEQNPVAMSMASDKLRSAFGQYYPPPAPPQRLSAKQPEGGIILGLLPLDSAA